MAPLRVSTTKSEWLPDDPTAFVPTRLWKLPFITTWDDSRNQNRPTDSTEEAHFHRRNQRAGRYRRATEDGAAATVVHRPQSRTEERKIRLRLRGPGEFRAVQACLIPGIG